jgi:hypothetical protein
MKTENYKLGETQGGDATVSIAKCPSCGCEFEDLRFYSIGQVALVFGVAQATVKDWLAKGTLRFRLYARSSNSIVRMVDSRDLREFINRRFPYPGEDTNPLATRLWAWVQRSGSRGGRATAERKRLKNGK